jgi:aspartate/methionine/tyrosine aminotransferase
LKQIARRCLSMEHSGIREIMELASQIEGAIHLEVGQPGFETPQHIVEAGIRGLQEGYTKYTSSYGYPELRKLIAEKLRKKNRFHADWKDVTVTPGGVFACAIAMFTLLDEGDEVILPDICWPNYRMLINVIGVKPSYYHIRADLPECVDFTSLRDAVTERSKLLIVNSPANPTGSVFSLKTVEKIASFIQEHDLYLLSDEVYEDLVYEGEHTSPARYDTEGRIFSVFSFSKSYAMTGWRVAYLHSPPEMTSAVQKFPEPFISCPPSVSQRAAIEALKGSQTVLDEMREMYKKRRDCALGILRSAGVHFFEPMGAFYIFCDISRSGMDSYSFAKLLLKEEKVAVAPGKAFGPGGENYVRIAFTPEIESIKEGVRKFAGFL